MAFKGKRRSYPGGRGVSPLGSAERPYKDHLYNTYSTHKVVSEFATGGTPERRERWCLIGVVTAYRRGRTSAMGLSARTGTFSSKPLSLSASVRAGGISIILLAVPWASLLSC